MCLKPADAHSTRHSHSPSQTPTKSQHATTTGSNNATPTKCKRPMNAFMLFAKKFRVEYTQMYPGKDNRWVCCVSTCVEKAVSAYCMVMYKCVHIFMCVCVCVCVSEQSASSLVSGGRKCEVRSGGRSLYRPKPSQTNRKDSTQTVGNANELAR